MRPAGNDPEAATENLNARGQGAQSDNGDQARQRRRGGGGLSAADLLRREGRL
jgi:RND superfamily putative drug exporter